MRTYSVGGKTLIKNGTFKLPGKKALKEAGGTIEYIVIDVTESLINRPKKPESHYSGKKKRHTIKTR